MGPQRCFVVYSFWILSYVRLPLHSKIQQKLLGLTVVVTKGNDGS